MIVWSRAPRSASWVPTVWRKRWAADGAAGARPPLADQVTGFGLHAGVLERGLEEVERCDNSLPWLMNR